MAKYQVQNNIRLLLDAPVAPSDTQITVQRAIAPDQEPTAPTGGDKLHLTLVDNFGTPSVTEIVNVTAITDNGATLTLTVDRAQEGTTAGAFPQGFVFQAATAGVINSKQDADDAQAFFDRTDNPHNVTKAQVGLGDVDNVSASDLRDRTTHTGEQPISTVTGLQGELDGKANLVAGKIPQSELPAIAMTEVHVVADVTERDALVVEEGDVAIVQDAGQGESASFIYDGTAWQELLTPTDGVTAVTGSGGLDSTGGTTPDLFIKNLGVTEPKIADGAVTNVKLAGGIDPAKITGTAVVDADDRLSEGLASAETVRSLGTGATQALPGDYDVAGQAPVQSVAGKTGDVNLNSDEVSEGSTNQYWKEAPSDTKQYARQDGAWTEVVIPEGYGTSDFATDFGAKSTDDLAEGSGNVYFTNARSIAAIQGDNSWNATNWDTAYSWGDHSTAGYLTGFTESDPTVPSHVKGISTGNISNWNTAYNWGNHASAGYQPASTAITTSNIGSQSVNYASSSGNADTVDGLHSSSFVQTGNNSSLNSDSRNTRGVTRLYRRDGNSDYSVQTYWTGSRWRLYGYVGDSNHADTHVGYADNADTVDGLHESTFMRREANSNLDMNNYDIYGVDQIFHHGDTNTYMQFHAADQWRVVTGGAERLEVNNSAVSVNGTLNVSGAINVNGSSVGSPPTTAGAVGTYAFAGQGYGTVSFGSTVSGWDIYPTSALSSLTVGIYGNGSPQAQLNGGNINGGTWRCMGVLDAIDNTIDQSVLIGAGFCATLWIRIA